MKYRQFSVMNKIITIVGRETKRTKLLILEKLITKMLDVRHFIFPFETHEAKLECGTWLGFLTTYDPFISKVARATQLYL